MTKTATKFRVVRTFTRLFDVPLTLSFWKENVIGVKASDYNMIMLSCPIISAILFELANISLSACPSVRPSSPPAQVP